MRDHDYDLSTKHRKNNIRITVTCSRKKFTLQKTFSPLLTTKYQEHTIDVQLLSKI